MSLALVAVIAMSLLVACNKSYSDKPTEAKEQVERNKFVVTAFYDSSKEPDPYGQIGYLVAKKSSTNKTVTLRIYFYDTPANAYIALEEMEADLIIERLSNFGGKLSYRVDGSKIVVKKTVKGLSGGMWG